jgi:hydrogenase maturation protease
MDVTVLDIGVSLLDALPYLEKAERIVIVDAMKGDGLPGTVYRVPFGECATKEYVASMHGFDIGRVFAMAQRRDLPEITVIGVEPEKIEWSLDLSPAVAASLPAIVRIVEEEIKEGGRADRPSTRQTVKRQPCSGLSSAECNIR